MGEGSRSRVLEQLGDRVWRAWRPYKQVAWLSESWREPFSHGGGLGAHLVCLEVRPEG